jgi:hypothetical protein
LTIGNSTISQNVGVSYGGGIDNTGTLTVINSTLSSNAGNYGGGIRDYSLGLLTLENSTVNANGSILGGGIYVDGGPAVLENCTIYGNSLINSYGDGGGLYLAGGTVAMNNCTLSQNTAGSNGFGGDIADAVGGVHVQNTIVAYTPGSGGNCTGSIVSNGYNLSSDNSCPFNNTGDLNNTDPLLGPLQNNGGPTQTQALRPGSPAIDAGNPAPNDGQGNDCLPTDQRGNPRTDRCDIGAYEYP